MDQRTRVEAVGGGAAVVGGGFVAQLTEIKDPDASRGYCLKHVSPQQAGTVCELPMLWMKAPSRP